jgi:hypothetical protein
MGAVQGGASGFHARNGSLGVHSGQTECHADSTRSKPLNCPTDMTVHKIQRLVSHGREVSDSRTVAQENFPTQFVWQ